MKIRNITVPLIWATLLLFACSGAVLAQGKAAGNHDRSYGVDQPKPIDNVSRWQQPEEPESLPAKGKSADSHRNSYGIGQPKNTHDLPPGLLRKRLEGLPAKAKGKSLGCL